MNCEIVEGRGYVEGKGGVEVSLLGTHTRCESRQISAKAMKNDRDLDLLRRIL